MSQIKVTNLTFAYDGSYDNIFENVSFQIDTDWKLGFIGRNGRGKTTFLNLLMGKYEYRGSITSSISSFDYFPFAVENESLNTLDIFYSVNSDCELWMLQRELSLLEVDEEVLYRPFCTLSNGERTKILLCVLFTKSNNFLLIDEPTNHLDAGARTIVSNYLKSKKSFIIVSHDRAFLDNCIDHVLSINKANIEVQKGGFSSWFENKQKRDEFELAENERLKKDIKRLESSSRRTANWSDKVEKSKIGAKTSGVKADKGFIGHKAAKMMKRSKAIESRKETAISEKSKLLKNIDTADKLAIRPIAHHSERLIDMCGISINYGEKCVCENINLTVTKGERVLILGKNGSGKSSILKLIIDEIDSFTGEIYRASNLIVSYVCQDTSYLSGDLQQFAKSHHLDLGLFISILRKLDFSRTQFDKDIKDYSHGQKKKVLIAKSLCEKAHLYIWDEPLNYIDVLSRIQIEELLIMYKPTMIFVEHDVEFAEKIATKTIRL